MRNANILVLIGSITLSVLISCLIMKEQQPKIGYVKTQKIFEEFAGTKAFQVKLEKLNQHQRAILDSMSLELAMLSGKVENQVLEQKRQLFQQVKQEFVAESQSELNTRSNQAWNHINQYVKAYGTENGYQYIFGATGSGGIMYADDAEDLTEEVIHYINYSYAGN